MNSISAGRAIQIMDYAIFLIYDEKAIYQEYGVYAVPIL